MTLVLTEADVRSVLTMPAALEAVEEGFRRLAAGTAILHSRQRIHVPEKGFLHYMAAADTVSGYAGLKIYTSAGGALRFLVPLIRPETGELVALLEADYLGQVRTGAASGVATKYMARQAARTVGLVGAGLQARTQLEAIAQVRPIVSVRVFARDAERRRQFADEMRKRLSLSVEPVDTSEAAVREADIVVTATSASQPVVEGRWLAPGVHINAIGANFPQKRELDAEAVRRARVIAADSREQSKQEAGDLIHVFGQDEKGWEMVHELADIVAGRKRGRNNDEEVTLFKSNGIAVEDVVVAARVYELAKVRGIGRHIPLWER